MKLLPALTLTGALLTTGCATTAQFGTGVETDPTCDVLRAHLPSYSTHDTEVTKREGAKFLDVFKAVCP